MARGAEPRGWHLLERERELAAIEAALASAGAGEGRLVAVEGAAGTGKSTLIHEAAERAEAAGMHVLAASGTELEREFPFGVALQLVEPPLRAAGADARADVLIGAARLAEPLLGGKAADAPADDDDRAFPLLHGLYWLIANLAERGPILLAVDDAHWADVLSLRLLLYLAARIEDMPVAAVVALRPAEPGSPAQLLRELGETPGAVRLPMRPLSTAAVETVVRELLPGAPPGTAEAAREATGGKPLLLRELLLAARELGEPPTPARLREIAPESISRRVARRFELMPEPVAAIARAAAIIGDGSSLREAAELAGIAPDDAASAADALAAADILEPRADVHFAHPIVLNAVYESVGAAARAEAHGRAARIVAARGRPPAAVAAHLLRSAPAADPWVVETLRGAAREAAERGSPASGVGYLRRALAEPPEDDVRGELLLELGRLESVTSSDEGVDHLQEAVDALGDPARRARALLELGNALNLQGRRAEAASAFERGLEIVPESERMLAAELDAAFVTVAFFEVSLSRKAMERVGAIVAQGAASDTPADRALLAVLAARQLVEGAPREAVLETARRAYAGGALVRELAPAAQPTQAAHIALFLGGDRELGLRSIEEMVEDARRRGSMAGFSIACQWRSQTYYRLGRLSDCLADAETALEATRAGWESVFPGTRGVYALARLERGDETGAVRALEADANPNDDTGTAFLEEARGHLALALGRPERAAGHFRACAERFLAAGWLNPAVAPWRAGLALALARLGEDEEATGLVEEAVSRAREFGAPRPLGIALHAAGLIEGGDGGIALLRDSVTALEESGDALAQARAVVDLGAALRRAGLQREARATLERGMDEAHRIEAVRLERRAADELRAAGARPRRAAIAGPEALTPSERRVARMAADGMTNRQIAEALFVTPKAVEKHLRNTYMKLEIASRDELPEALVA